MIGFQVKNESNKTSAMQGEEERMKKIRRDLIRRLNELNLPTEEHNAVLKEHYSMGIAACNSLARRIEEEKRKKERKWKNEPEQCASLNVHQTLDPEKEEIGIQIKEIQSSNFTEPQKEKKEQNEKTMSLNSVKKGAKMSFKVKSIQKGSKKQGNDSPKKSFLITNEKKKEEKNLENVRAKTKRSQVSPKRKIEEKNLREKCDQNPLGPNVTWKDDYSDYLNEKARLIEVQNKTINRIQECLSCREYLNKEPNRKSLFKSGIFSSFATNKINSVKTSFEGNHWPVGNHKWYFH